MHRLAIQAGVSGFVLSTALLFTPLLFLLRRWRPPAGSAAIVLGAQCLLMQALTDLADAGLAVLGLIGAVTIEALVAALRPAELHRERLRAFCAVAVFTTHEAAKEFVKDDPFVLEGVVSKWHIRAWNEMLAGS